MKPCHIAGFPDAGEAARNLEAETVRQYGTETFMPDGTKAHDNHRWDGGGRALLRCRKCGAFLLQQSSRIDNYGEDDEEARYCDWLFVASEEEADLLNLLLDPQDFENWPVRHLRMNTRGYFWTEGWDPEQADAGSVYPWLTGRACDRDDSVMGEDIPYDGEEDVESGGDDMRNADCRDQEFDNSQ